MYIPKYIYIFKCERLKDHQKINLILAWKCSKAAPAKQHENKGRKIGVKDSCAQWCNLWNTEMLLMIIFALYFDNISTIYWNRFYLNSSHSLSHSWIYKKKHINYAQYNICNDFQLIFPFSKFCSKTWKWELVFQVHFTWKWSRIDLHMAIFVFSLICY